MGIWRTGHSEGENKQLTIQNVCRFWNQFDAGLTRLSLLSSQVSNLRHRHANEPQAATSPSIYRINDHIVFSIDIEELVPNKGWVPFRCRMVFPLASMLAWSPTTCQSLMHHEQVT